MISSEDRVDCRLCPAGFSCDPVNGTLSLCPPGQHSPEGVLQCLTCPVDSVCTSGFPIRCWPGKEPNVDHTVCNDCPPGLYSTICTIHCIQCPAGSYCPDSGMTQPLPCPPTWSSTHGQTECRSCNDTSLLCGGAVAPRWNQPVHRSSQTISCRPGTYKDQREELACVICPVGHYCVGGVAVPCPAGTYGPNEGLQRLRDCTICPAGFYCLEGSSRRPTSQFLCTQGYYCEEGTLTPNGSPCPAGTAGEQMGQTSRAACKRCREGRFCPAGSSGPGLPCARGRYCPAGTLEEVICPRGTFTPHQGAISVKDCLKCPAGFYCPEGRSDPVPCPPSSFNPLEGQDELDDCRECYAGKACTQVALKAPDVDCMQGFVCPPGSSQPNAPTNACPPGTLSDRTDLTDRSQCQQCLARYACLRGTGGIQRPPLFCFSGHYCPPGTMFPTQHKCPVGTWSGQSGLEAESECRPCPQGWYCLAGSAAPSGRCSSGHYCPEGTPGCGINDSIGGTAYGTQFPCPAGTYSIHIGNRYREDCLICPEGSFCQKGTSKPSPCPISTFRHLKGGRRQDDCSACSAGYFCPHSATVNPRVCGAGSYSDEGSVECSPCLQGHYCSDETTSEEAMLSVMVCPPGFLCSQGLARDPQRSATLCPRGFFCPGGGIDPNPIPCTNGTYGESPGLRDASECAQCPKGEYCYSQEPQEQPITRPAFVLMGTIAPEGLVTPSLTPVRLDNIGTTLLVTVERHVFYVHPGIIATDRELTRLQSALRAFTVRRALLLPNLVLKEPTARVQLSVMGLSAPLVLEDSIAPVWDSQSPREAAKSASTVEKEPNGPTGGLCPVGSYCPPASSSPLPCPSGTFSNSTGLSRPEECVSCPPGFYCLGSNNTSPSGPCFPGFYCTGGSASPVQSEAEEGYYTLERAARQQPCPLGTYQPRRGAQSCVECQGGRLCNQTALSRPPMCPQGHFCPPGYSAARPCPPVSSFNECTFALKLHSNSDVGSYSDQPGGDAVHHCRPCEAGWFCSRAGLSEPQGLCDPGHYCTSGASTASPVALLSGGVCSAGYICPRGTSYSQQHPCPAGTWSSTVGAQNMSSCWPCPSGLYCNNTGLSKPSGLWYYCSGGAVSSMPSESLTGDICPIGHYCPMGSTSPLLCPDGTFFNSTGAEECDDCLSGTYCLSGEGVQHCPAGHYCFDGSVEGILPCPPGTYSPQFGLSQVEQCLICPAGFYCEDWGLFEPTGPCQAGYYCIAGVNFQNPDGNFSTGVGGTCPKGKYCPEGTSLPCPAHQTSLAVIHVQRVFSVALQVSLVHLDCVRQDFTVQGETQKLQAQKEVFAHKLITALRVVRARCHAQLEPTPSSQANQCVPAALLATTVQRRLETSPSPPVPLVSTAPTVDSPKPLSVMVMYLYEFIEGTRHATQFPCPRGYYNPEPMTQSLDSCLPCPPGHYCEKERLTKVSGKCKAGWFCVSAAWNSQPFDLDNYTNANCSSEPVPCPPGTFCNISGLALPMGPCFPGYFCVGGATEAKPTDGGTGSICPPGAYCVEGSGEPELCPAGTFSPVPGLTSEASCQPCTAGVYCREAGLRAPTGPCNQGYWCPPGQTVATALPCPPGHFCVQGSATPEPCPSGTYQDREKQAACTICGAGYYCDLRLANASFLRPCPKGHYCPAGTSMPDQHPCPSGSFNPRVHTASLTACMPCAAGHFCPSVGLSEPAGPCNAGYWCREGASSPSPLDGRSGSLCPPGQYCPSGTTAPMACPEGSWSNSSGLRIQEDCKLCLGGFYCDSAGLTKPSGPCSGGYYCVEGAVTPTPTDGMTGGPCPEGSYCPEGTVQPLPCKPGTYVAVTHATECEPCVAGWYCVSGSLYLCPPGFYCPEGTGFDLRGCPEGTYGPDPGYWSASQCRQCDGGHYCSSRNGTAVTGQCQEGYYCSHGNTSPQPLSRAAGRAMSCRSLLPQAATNPLPCPRGTFSDLTKLASQEDCQPCLPGYYCDAAGLSVPSGECWEGFFCLGGADRPDPPLIDSRGGPCPKGYYCSEGSVAPQQCPLGTISTEDSRADCGACPQGFYCPGNNGSLSRTYECPVGHYCPSGTWSKHQYPCPAGSINPHTQMAQPQDCLPCPPGSFCLSPGKSVATGQCEAGYYCLSGAWSPTPEDGETTGDRCPEGHYCPQGSSAPVPCPIGRYSNTTRNRYLSDCLTCPPGFLCVTRGLSFPSHICPAGYYCPGKVNSSQQAAIPCSPGNMCPPGSGRQVPCLPGTYQDLPGQAECFQCPAGFYCAGSVDSGTVHVSGTHSPTLCPKGHYCPPGTQSGVAFPCPAGAFSRQMGLSNKSGCALCPPGRYCSSSGLAAPTGPEEGPTGGHCSPGSYCPQGTSLMVPCPASTFSTVDGAVSIEVCQPCLPGHYCAEVGLSSPSGLCNPGFYCREGSRTATPWGNYTGETTPTSPHSGNSTMGQFHGGVCPAGHYCPKGSAKPSPCPPACYPGSYCPSWAQTSADLLCPPGGSARQDQCLDISQAIAAHLAMCVHSVVLSRTYVALAHFNLYLDSTLVTAAHQGSVVPSPCPMGSVSASAGRTSLADCPPCPSGSFCNSSGLTEPSGPCSPVSHECCRLSVRCLIALSTTGHVCSLGSTEPSPVSQPYGDVCPMGHICPQGSGLPIPCPAGSFLPEPGASSLTQCRRCPPGKYCVSPGSSQPTGLCFAGFFCSGDTESPTPRANSASLSCLCEILEDYTPKTDAPSGFTICLASITPGTLADSDSILSDSPPCVKSPHYACSTYRGDICPKGFYCPLGSAFPLPCEAGSYCNKTGLDVPTGPCAAGYYCPKGSLNPHASLCPPGHYCPPGTLLPLPCPVGTIQSSLGGSTVEACQQCPQGHYCHQRGKTEPSGWCAEGYYCPGGQSTERPQQNVCSVGHYCEKGSVKPTACLPGSYQLRQGQGSCETCPGGSHCPDQGMTIPMPCERGFYCPSGSANQHPCPAGTYGNKSGMVEEWQCSLCDPGVYCKGTGRTFPSGPCNAGFVCVGGASEPSPLDKLTGFPCPPGFFCSVRTSVPKPCPKGTFSKQSGLVDESQCRSCSPGFYCSETGLSAVSGACLPGFYCLEGSHTATPMSSVSGGVCPAGHYCAEAALCPHPAQLALTKMRLEEKAKITAKHARLDLAGQKECNPCPPGFHCQSPSPSATRGSSTGVSNPLPCPAGYICPRESQPVPCPKGTYSPSHGLLPQFCGSEGLIQPSGSCASGFLCLMGATVPNPTDNKTGSLCPPGTFCQQGLRAGDCWPGRTPVPMPCPAGTFSSEIGNTHQNNCTPCTPGYYCQDAGSVQPALCPVGYYCPPGLTLGLEFPCPPGTVQSQIGASSPDACLPCPAGMFCSQPGLSQPSGLCEGGYFCPGESTSPNSTEYQGNYTRTHICPSGHYCPSGTGFPLPCPTGSLSIFRGLKAVDGCPPCPPGLFCDRPAIAELSNARPCSAGYVCLGGSSSPMPSDSSHGYLCPLAIAVLLALQSRCPVSPALTVLPLELPTGPGVLPQPLKRPQSAQLVRVCKSDILPLYIKQQFWQLEECTDLQSSHFCPAGTALPQRCPLGTFSNQTGAFFLSVCTPCPSGLYCGSYGASTPQGSCLLGYFCQGGAIEPTPQSSDKFPMNGPCPWATTVHQGASPQFHALLAVFATPSELAFAFERGPNGFLMFSARLICITVVIGGVSMESCSACPVGHYCSTEGLANPSGPCAAGFFCPFDFSSTTPYAFLCPKGHYCPEGSALALPCPTGEYQPNPGSDICIPCRPGFYCEEAIVGEPWPCPPHSFCPAGTMVPQPCPNGTYTHSNQGGLQEERECLPCPSGRFCRAGRIQGVCAAGYLCVSGSADFTPQGPVSNMTQCQSGMQCAGPCPAGTAIFERKQPKPTMEILILSSLHLGQVSSVVKAQRRLSCVLQTLSGAPQEVPAYRTVYPALLSIGVNLEIQSFIRVLLVFTVMVCLAVTSMEGRGQGFVRCTHIEPTPGQAARGTAWPARLVHTVTAQGLQTPPTVPAHLVFGAVDPDPPSSAPRALRGPFLEPLHPASVNCVRGEPSAQTLGLQGSPMWRGFPAEPLINVPWRGCAELAHIVDLRLLSLKSVLKGICVLKDLIPTKPQSNCDCPFPYHCPANSSSMKSCDGGFMPVNTSGLRGSKNSCCTVCDEGTYRQYLSPIQKCLPCPAGYFCPSGTDNYKSNPCPFWVCLYHRIHTTNTLPCWLLWQPPSC
ncbi:hypothetical protein F7725_020773 [Dissostichus mawsoni]|uniref:TNFR-Cys domain-containing protein n=1 Tax=Dissostichus mawsoni TaxID=36200 RepID=A0A7J5YE74_DISMA|nr:hypothetical protein F7725_020773 [Dissostichus mawsoni]